MIEVLEFDKVEMRVGTVLEAWVKRHTWTHCPRDTKIENIKSLSVPRMYLESIEWL